MEHRDEEVIIHENCAACFRSISARGLSRRVEDEPLVRPELACDVVQFCGWLAEVGHVKAYVRVIVSSKVVAGRHNKSCDVQS